MVVNTETIAKIGVLNMELDPSNRVGRLREMYWAKTHLAAFVRKAVVGCGENTLTGHARDFAALLEASDPFIQPDELIVGCCLAVPSDRTAINLGYYNSHYPPGHKVILHKGLAGIRDEARARLQAEADSEKQDFFRAVEISYDAACEFVEKYAQHACAMAASETNVSRKADLQRIYEACHEIAAQLPTSFHAALQLFQFTRIFGGYGCIGRFDQWMYPFYKRDIESGKLSQQEAQELLECLFIKLNQFADVNETTPGVYLNNDNLRNIALAGQTPDSRDACNELTYMCLEASAKLMLPDPKLNVRLFRGSPPELLRECCRVLAKGANTLSFFNDEVAIPALSRLGIPIEDARDYCNDGCSELLIGGRSTIRFRVYDSLAALTETALAAEQHPYPTFDAVMADFKARLKAFMPEGPAPEDPVTFPYFVASIEDCMAKGSVAGARYSISGWILAEMGNTADGLSAIKKLIYDDRSITWDELVAALRADYQGYEPLCQMIRNRVPRYGNDRDEVDRIIKDIAEYYCDSVHERGQNRQGPGGKRAAGFMSFGIHKKSDLPASPDGRRRGEPTANSFSPAVGMDRGGPTAVLKSAAKVDLARASQGSVLDIALHSSVFRGAEGLGKLVMLVDSFLKLPCTATLQLNIIDRDTLLRARANPTAPEYRTLIVRVWGFSAVFVELHPDLQEHVLARTEHTF